MHQASLWLFNRLLARSLFVAGVMCLTHWESAAAQTAGDPPFPSDVALLSIPTERGLICFPPTGNDTANATMVFREGAHPTEFREMRVTLGPSGELRSLGETQWGFDSLRRSVMYTIVASWESAAPTGLFIVMPMLGDPATAPPPKRRPLTAAELVRAQALASWLVKMRCDRIPHPTDAR